MPRAGQYRKSQHSQRHESGLVDPGKRVSKQKSNGQFNSERQPVTPVIPGSPDLETEDVPEFADSHVLPVASYPKHGSAHYATSATYCKHGSDLPTDEQNAQQSASTRGKSCVGESCRNDCYCLQSLSSENPRLLGLPSNIVKASQTFDVIAMLLLLLQLPPACLTFIQALFASTSLIPSNGFSIWSVSSLFDASQAPVGTPSLGTTIVLDILCLAAWFCLWEWARYFTFDLAQVQIAVSLGVGERSKSIVVNGVCIFITMLVHVVKGPSSHRLLHGFPLPASKLLRDSSMHLVRIRTVEECDSPTHAPPWYRSLFAIHIVTQACVAIIRRHITSTQASYVSQPAKLSRRATTETPSFSQAHGGGSAADIPTIVSSNGPIERASPVQLPHSYDNKDRMLGSKKRKRPANQARTNQPFWAALAWAKINALHELGSDALSNTSATSPVDASSAPHLRQCQVRITAVTSSNITFEAVRQPEIYDSPGSGLVTPLERLCLRINGASWTSTSIHPPMSGQRPGLWYGEIYGLAPNCIYSCVFALADCGIVASFTVNTPAAPTQDHSLSSSKSYVDLFPLPLSPITTIRQSIISTNARLSKARSHSTKVRRAHRATLAKLEKEIESFQGRLLSSSDDTKQKQKLLQAERTIKQHEDISKSITTALDALRGLPDDTATIYAGKKDTYDNHCIRLAATNESLAFAKSISSVEVARLDEAFKAIGRQHERLLARQLRLNEQHERITQANTQGLDEIERRAEEASAKQRDYSRLEVQYSQQLSILQRELTGLSTRTQAANDECHNVEASLTLLRKNHVAS